MALWKEHRREIPQISTNVQELRTYEAVPGNLPALNDRFANHTNALFQKHGMEVVGYWTEVVGTSNQLVYMLGYDGLGDREKSWGAFQNDPDWQKARAASEVNGPLVKRSHNRILRRTAYSPRSRPTGRTSPSCATRVAPRGGSSLF